jgi:hypothetical protein
MTMNQAYIENVKAARGAEHLAAQWFRNRGDSAIVLKKKIAKDQSEYLDCLDHGDLMVVMRSFGSTNARIMGVKHRIKLDFTCEEDFPYPDIIVCSVNSWIHSDPKPRGFLNINKAKTHLCMVWSSTWNVWTKKTVHDKRYGTDQVDFFCPIEFTAFFPMEAPNE